MDKGVKNLSKFPTIAGLTYKRLPEHGEKIRTRCVSTGNYISCQVWAGDEHLIAWDLIPLPVKPDREDAARAKRERLASAAAEHWRKAGFEVDG